MKVPLIENEDFIKDIKDITLLSRDITNKHKVCSGLVKYYRKKFNIPKSKYKNIPVGLINEFEEDLFSLNIPDIQKKWNVGNYTILKARENLSLKGVYKNSYLHKDEYILDLSNPCLKHNDIANKWGVSISTVCRNRKILGYGFWPQTTRTKLETKLASILEELDLGFTEQKKILKYTVDFYLGNKLIIDIHGRWVHSLEESIKRDSEKEKILKTNEYIYVVIWEEELQNENLLKDKILFYYEESFKKRFGVALYSNV